MAKWIVSGSGEKVEQGYSPGTTRVTVRISHFNVEVVASSGSHAHDVVLKTLSEAGWRTVTLTGINQEV